jgi:hypothetical protein
MRSAIGKVAEGHYEIRTSPGETRVRITAPRKTGKMLDDGMGVKTPELVDILPPKYNSASTLTRTIETSGKATIDFKLE